MADVATCDASAVQILYELFESYRVRFRIYFRLLFPEPQILQGRDVGVFITHLHMEPRAMFERGGIVELLGEDAFYEDVSKAMRRLTGVTQG